MALPHYSTAEKITAFVVYLVDPEAGFVTGASLTTECVPSPRFYCSRESRQREAFSYDSHM
jgi:hypothetical protein